MNFTLTINIKPHLYYISSNNNHHNWFFSVVYSKSSKVGKTLQISLILWGWEGQKTEWTKPYNLGVRSVMPSH